MEKRTPIAAKAEECRAVRVSTENGTTVRIEKETRGPIAVSCGL